MEFFMFSYLKLTSFLWFNDVVQKFMVQDHGHLPLIFIISVQWYVYMNVCCNTAQTYLNILPI